jgi:hypothetical protein
VTRGHFGDAERAVLKQISLDGLEPRGADAAPTRELGRIDVAWGA